MAHREETGMAEVSSADIDRTVEGRTPAGDFVATVTAHGDRQALRWKDGDGWAGWTFAEYGDRVARATSAFRAMGLSPGERIILMMRNIPEFHVLDMAALMCGATPISVFNSSSSDQIAYLVGHCGAKVAVVEDAGFLARFTPVRDQLGDLKAIGMLRPEGADSAVAFGVGELLEHDPADLEAAAASAGPDDLATVIYTSGTTGPPKGVMITNANVTWTVECLRTAIAIEDLAGKRLVSYLPMAHIAERMTSHYQQVVAGYEVTCCPEPGQIAAYAREVKPNIMFGVPRVWEKIQAGVVGALAADAERARQFDEAIEAAKPIVQRMAWDLASDDDRATWSFLDDVAFRSIRELLGLDQLDLAITGAAPMTAELLAWYRAVGVPMSEIYGMSESSGPMTWAPYKVKPGTVGAACPGIEVTIAEDGEVLCRGGNVFLGYLDQPEKTAEALDDEGWLHSGDIGRLDEDGYLKIIDRKKELIITAGGKNVSPANLEAALKSIPLVGQACAIGDQRPFVAALVVLDPDTAPAWAAQHGIADRDLGSLAENPEVQAEVERGLHEAMAAFNNVERVKKVRILGNEWLPDSEELTPTSKLKRRGIHAKYADEIEALYS
jgi:long-chain acyl-CoA synthetase